MESHSRKQCSSVLQLVKEQTSLGYKAEQVHKVVRRLNEPICADQVKFLNLNHVGSARCRYYLSRRKNQTIEEMNERISASNTPKNLKKIRNIIELRYSGNAPKTEPEQKQFPKHLNSFCKKNLT